MTRGKAAIPLDLPRPPGLSSRGGASKQDRIADALREAILQGRLAAGGALPSTRTLAERWRVARGTVEVAFERLVAEGYLSRVRGSGTRVSAVVPEAYLMAPAADAHGEAAVAVDIAPASADPSRLRRSPDAARDASPTGTRIGQPFVARLADPALLPAATWKRHLAQALAGLKPAELGAAVPGGDARLRARIAAWLGEYRGIACRAEDVFITAGIRHSLDLVMRAIEVRGRRVAIEDPGYPMTERLAALNGAAVAQVPVDPQGLVVERLAALPGIVAAYVTPAHQSPLGVTMSVSRRLELLDWARREQAWIVEDDYDGEFSYQAAPLPALKALDRHDRAIYCGSFNKTLFAGLRLGYVVAPAALRAPLEALLAALGRPVGVIEQRALAGLIGNGDFARHLRASRQAYQQRRDAVLERLAAGAAGRYAISGEQAGFHFMLWLDPGSDEAAFVAAAAAAGIALQPLGMFCREARLPPAVLVGYTALTLAQARHAGRALAQVLAGFAQGKA
ncbi:aminotransferase class I and II family protein [Burkholderia gladioli]|uniref:Aminotransferase class I and II family protein n=1 Tax=Burkholderia gladioli TaxID=28095 RepID=A0AAW3F368_BURGA|nr:PLP-dependent aminotransferase family protein [Burkholderia gladioli]AJW95291.1 aminotransferase class I and II family protein [Burkholderia gladioli]ASD84064.1 PLP-dependent aminotransferase family protein [Burkholderia gladioli pv. gladioli]AWY51487.1 PLP-dependent aminotransferase family protein [Burkholderia gladioli pv. gladioli]KGC15292.1 aminotransferase class I and II family protein [Burkholderia gladioli]SPU88872.1 GntR family transcriptional regulator [Burkholderia gladioli]